MKSPRRGEYIIVKMEMWDEDPDIEAARRCSIVVTGFSDSMSDGSKDQLLEPIYSKGGKVRWVSPSEAVAVLPTESIANGIRLGSPIRLTSMNNLSSSVIGTYDSSK
jgi:hypothetical protein